MNHNQQNSAEIALSIVRYGDVDIVEQFVATINRSPFRELVALAVADNGPGSDSVLRDLYESGAIDHLLEARHNPGYFPSAFEGLRDITTDETKWAVITNPDVELNLEKMLSVLQSISPDEAVVIAPNVFDLMSSLRDNPHILRRPSLRWFLSRALIHSMYFTHVVLVMVHEKRQRHAARSKKRTFAAPVGTNMYAPIGTIVALSRPALDILMSSADGSQAILYAEEIWLGEECLRLDIPIRYQPDWDVIHASHAVTGKLSTKARQLLWRRAALRSLQLRLRRKARVS